MSEENQVVEVAPEIIEEARQQGWVPKEEFRGPEDQWTDAETFVKRGREINPILRKHNKELKLEIEKLRKQAEEATSTAKEFREFVKKQTEQKVRTLEQEIIQLREARKQAISSGDGDSVDAIESRLDELKEEKEVLKQAPEPQPQQQEPQIDPTLQAWIERNDWYREDEELQEITNGIAAAVRRQNPNLMGQAFLDKLDERLEERGLKKTKKSRSETAPTVEGSSGTGAPSKGKKGYADLPADAKAACDKYVKQGLFKTREEYVAEYFS